MGAIKVGGQVKVVGHYALFDFLRWTVVNIDSRTDLVTIESPRNGNRVQLARRWVEAVQS